MFRIADMRMASARLCPICRSISRAQRHCLLGSSAARHPRRPVRLFPRLAPAFFSACFLSRGAALHVWIRRTRTGSSSGGFSIRFRSCSDSSPAMEGRKEPAAETVSCAANFWREAGGWRSSAGRERGGRIHQQDRRWRGKRARSTDGARRTGIPGPTGRGPVL